MKNKINRSYVQAFTGFFQSPFLATLLLAMAIILNVHTSYAGNATWNLNPVSGDWNTAANWTPATVPNGPSDIATFGVSNSTAVSLSDFIEVNNIIFEPGASAYTITSDPAGTFSLLTISGVGITNSSGIVQSLVCDTDIAGGQGAITFTTSASAGSLTVFTNRANPIVGKDSGDTDFVDASSAGNATFVNKGAVISGGSAGSTRFFFNSTASNGTFTNNGGVVSGAVGGVIFFLGGSTASNGTFTTNGGAVSGATGGVIVFFDTSHAGNATLIANDGVDGAGGGVIQFQSGTRGDTARVELFGNGSLDISFHRSQGVTVGSIEGGGSVFLGSRILVVGSNNLSTTFSGVIQDGTGGTGGSLTKIGKGKLTLSNASTHTGGTTISKGALIVKNKTGSATGTGPVQVNLGTLQGVGKISGAVTVGTGTTSGAILLAGNNATSPGILTINNTLTFNSLSTYQCVLNRTKGKASTLTALGVTINSGATFTFTDTGTGTLTTGTIFKVINNTSANPIFGTFSNLPNGSTFASNGNNFQVSYTGGTGNDLTLTVVP